MDRGLQHLKSMPMTGEPVPVSSASDPLAGQHVVVLGLARQGMALARRLPTDGARVTVSDRRPAEKLAAEVAALEGVPARFVLGGNPTELLDG